VLNGIAGRGEKKRKLLDEEGGRGKKKGRKGLGTQATLS